MTLLIRAIIFGMQASHPDNSLEIARTTSTDIGETFLLWGTRLGRNKMCLPPDPFGVARESAIGHARLPTEVPQIKHVSVASYPRCKALLYTYWATLGRTS